MKFTDYSAHNLRRKSKDKVKQQFAEYALAGLRRPVYAGVFQKLAGMKTPTYICDLILDGYQRNLTIHLKELATDAGEENSQQRYLATIQNLPLRQKQKPFELSRIDPGTGRSYLKGALDLGTAQLVTTVLPHCDAYGLNPWVCVLEILRPEG